jgi:ethanolamine utilization cobalamin adenosyltransferase
MNETHLYPGHCVSKDHPRINFRGALDSLAADILEAQLLAVNMKDDYCLKALGEVLEFVYKIMSAEVSDQPVFDRDSVQPIKLFGLTLDELHEQTHKVKEFFGFTHPKPEVTMGELPLRLNTLRTRVRETELIAVRTFQDRDDIVYALNRLSSAIYWLYCHCIKPQMKSSVLA